MEMFKGGRDAGCFRGCGRFLVLVVGRSGLQGFRIPVSHQLREHSFLLFIYVRSNLVLIIGSVCMQFNPIVIVTRAEKPAWYLSTAPYARPSLRCALWQLVTTLVPYFLLLALMVQTVRRGYPYAVTLALAFAASFLLLRIFIVFHDCTHGAFLPSPRWNRNVGYLCGLLTFTAFHDWRRSHAGHHISAGDLDRRGVGDIWTMTVDEYRAAPPLQRLGYRLYRHPLVTFGIGPTYFFCCATASRPT